MTISDQLALSRQLVMTPQLQMAIKLLAQTNAEVSTVIEEFLVAHPGAISPIASGEDDPGNAPDEDGHAWTFLDTTPFADAHGDIFVFGNPPQCRANGRAFPRWKAIAGDRDAEWFVRSLRQRAKSYEKIVAALVTLQPAIAISVDADVERVSPRAIAEIVGMHESTIARVAQGCTLQNMHGVHAVKEFIGTKRSAPRRGPSSPKSRSSSARRPRR